MTLIAVILSYLIGSLSCAIIVCKLMGLPDPRTQGSNNPGATNVLRYGGKSAAALTLLGDALKGFIPVFIAKWYGFDAVSLSLIILAAFIGHLYPVYFRFEGGKGVATALGCIFALAWPIGIAFMVTWLLMAVIFRYSSLAALTAALLMPFYTWYFSNSVFAVAVGIMSALLIYRHQKNIVNLYRGQESKIGKKTTQKK